MKKITLIIAFSILIFSCAKDDNNISIDNPFSKSWFMDSYLSFGGTFNFSESYVLFDFSQSETTVQVINYTNVSTFVLTSGIYDYSITENTVTIDNQTFDYRIENGKLVLSDMPEVDGPVIEFVEKINGCGVDPFQEKEWLRDARDTIHVIDCAGISAIEQYYKDDTCIYQIQICSESADTHLNFYDSEGNLLCENIEIGEEVDCLGMAIDTYKKRSLLGVYDVINPIFCDQETIINNNQYINTELSEVTINTIEIIDNCLHIAYSASGCDGNTWEIKLIDSGDILESNPLQRNLKLSLVNPEACTAVISKETSFDISNIQVQGVNEVQLNIVNTQTEILYEY